MKYNVTNVSMQSDKGARSVFLTEAGKLLKAGDSIACNRIDSGTWGLAKAGILKVEEGNFPPPPIFKEALPKVEEDESVATPPRPENLAARRADADEMDKRLAAAKVAEDAKVPADKAPKMADKPKSVDKPKSGGATPVSFDDATSKGLVAEVDESTNTKQRDGKF